MIVNQLIRMVTRTLMHKGVNMGVNKGVDMFAGRGKSSQEMTPKERENAKRMKQQTGAARKMLRMGRRLR